MGENDWRPLLEQWSRELLEDTEYRQSLPANVVTSGWLGYPAASEAQLVATETRLGTRFPPSYRQFLSTTNGWRRTTVSMDRLWSTAEVEWFAVHHRDLIDIWVGESHGPSAPDAEYFVYGPGQSASDMRVEYLPTALEIGELGDYGSAIYLLNPQVVTSEGEWEAWLLATWLPGAARFRSFWELMQEEHNTFLLQRLTS
jgi:hypothetical protein